MTCLGLAPFLRLDLVSRTLRLCLLLLTHRNALAMLVGVPIKEVTIVMKLLVPVATVPVAPVNRKDQGVTAIAVATRATVMIGIVGVQIARIAAGEGSRILACVFETAYHMASR